MRASEKKKKIRKKVMMNCGLGWIRGLSGQEQDMSLLTLEWEPFVTVPGKRDHLGNFFKIELLLQQERVGFELQNALHI